MMKSIQVREIVEKTSSKRITDVKTDLSTKTKYEEKLFAT